VRPVLGLLQPRLQDRRVASGQRRGAVAAGVGVGRVDDVEDVVDLAVAVVDDRLDGSAAAAILLQRVTVLVVPERGLGDDPLTVDGAVDRAAVLGVGDGQLEVDRCAEVEDLPVPRLDHFDHRRGVADGDRDVRDPRTPGRVGDGELGGEVVAFGVGVLRVRLGGVDGAVGVEVPGVGDRMVIRVAGAGAGEVHRQRRLPGRGGRTRLGHRRALADLGVIDLVDAGVGVRVTASGAAVVAAPLDDVEGAVRPELQVDGAQELHAGQERVDDGRPAVLVELYLEDRVAGPLGDEHGVVVVLRELGFGVQVRVEVVGRAGDGQAPAFAQLR